MIPTCKKVGAVLISHSTDLHFRRRLFIKRMGVKEKAGNGKSRSGPVGLDQTSG